MYTNYLVIGCTIKKLVDVLGVKKSNKRDKLLVEMLNEGTMSHTVAGIEEILGLHRYGFWKNIFGWFNRKFLRKLLERQPDLSLDEELVYMERKIAFKSAFYLATQRQQGQDCDQVDNGRDFEISRSGSNDIEYRSTSGEEWSSEIISSLIPKPRLVKRVPKYTLDSLEERGLYSQKKRRKRQIEVEEESSS